MSRGVLTPRVDAPIDRVCSVNRLHPLNAGLVAWWMPIWGTSGGSTLVDLCGQHAAALVSMDPVTDWVSNTVVHAFSALNFDGSDDYAVFNPLPPLSTFTIAAWVRLTAGQAFGGIVNSRQSGRAGFQFTHDGSSTTAFQPHLCVWSGSAESSNTRIASSYTYPMAVPRLFVWTWNGSASAFYDNGVSIATEAGNTTWTPTHGSSLGEGWTDRNTGGDYHDIRVLNRAWSASEVRAYYDESRHGYPGTLNRIRLPFALQSGSPSASPSTSPSASPSSTPSASPSASLSASPSSSPSTTPSASTSTSPSASASSTPSESPSTSPSSSPSATASASPSGSPSASPSPSASVSASPSTSPSGAEATITLEGNVFAREAGGVNVDSNRLLQFQMANSDDVVLTFEETRVT